MNKLPSNLRTSYDLNNKNYKKKWFKIIAYVWIEYTDTEQEEEEGEKRL